ncbi:hypothetical protein [Saccharophagus degradans]|uniref:hypothetical protein n=1 Tax=Saccharophagus degradans TaxID=86304 RepID=UPI00059BCAA4|nr:hypothetical protein [Saccharophagus degradans]
MNQIKDNWLFYSAGIVVFLLLLRWFVVSSYPVQLVNEVYECNLSICKYEFDLLNNSSQIQSGEVWVKTYRKGGIKSDVSLEIVVERYSLAAYSKQTFQGSINSAGVVETLRFIHASK